LTDEIKLIGLRTDEILNGFFTEGIISCLTDDRADRNGDSMISTDELRAVEMIEVMI